MRGHAGLTPVVHQTVRQAAAPNRPTFVHKSSVRAGSFLARVSSEDFGAGMARLHAHGHGADQHDAVTAEIDWFVFTKHVLTTRRSNCSRRAQSLTRRFHCLCVSGQLEGDFVQISTLSNMGSVAHALPPAQESNAARVT
jgi:hypothetical protein